MRSAQAGKLGAFRFRIFAALCLTHFVACHKPERYEIGTIASAAQLCHIEMT
jgi:hypothetical protein